MPGATIVRLCMKIDGSRRAPGLRLVSATVVAAADSAVTYRSSPAGSVDRWATRWIGGHPVLLPSTPLPGPVHGPGLPAGPQRVGRSFERRPPLEDRDRVPGRAGPAG